MRSLFRRAGSTRQRLPHKRAIESSSLSAVTRGSMAIPGRPACTPCPLAGHGQSPRGHPSPPYHTGGGNGAALACWFSTNPHQMLLIPALASSCPVCAAGLFRQSFPRGALGPPVLLKAAHLPALYSIFNIDVFMQHFKMLRGCFSYGHTPCASDRGVLWGDGTLQLLQMRAALFYGLTRRAFRDKHSDSPQRFQLLEEHPLLSAGTFWCRVFQLRSVQSFTRGPLDALLLLVQCLGSGSWLR